MDRMLYISAVGLRNVEQAQTAHANNLANVSTHGFKADLARVMASEVGGEGYRSRVYGAGVGNGIDLSPGAQVQTERQLDLAINGPGLFAVSRADGSEGYTRNGAMQIDVNGRLLSAQGQQVMGQAGPIALPPFESIDFGIDGSITIRPLGQAPDALVQIDRLKIVDAPAERVSKGRDGLLEDNLGQGFPLLDTASVNSGFLESSNVNAISELTSILALARQFELEVKMMKVAETNDETASQLLRIG